MFGLDSTLAIFDAGSYLGSEKKRGKKHARASVESLAAIIFRHRFVRWRFSRCRRERKERERKKTEEEEEEEEEGRGERRDDEA